MAGLWTVHFSCPLDCATGHLVHGRVVAGFRRRLLYRLLVQDRPAGGEEPPPRLRPQPAKEARCRSYLKIRRSPPILRSSLPKSAGSCCGSRIPRSNRRLKTSKPPGTRPPRTSPNLAAPSPPSILTASCAAASATLCRLRPFIARLLTPHAPQLSMIRASSR